MITSQTRDEPVTLTVEDAARLLGIGRTLAYDAARRGELPTIRIGRRLLVPMAALDHLLGARSRPAAQRKHESPVNE